MNVEVYKYQLEFINPAVTSRNLIRHRPTYYIFLSEGDVTGIGEAGPLPGLSIDDTPHFGTDLIDLVEKFCQKPHDFNPTNHLDLPTAVFGIETANKHLKNGGGKVIFPGSFANGEPIEINGLVWMDEVEKMIDSAEAKLKQGFRCIKFKIGAKDHDEECRMIETIRKRFNAFKLEIRLDANCAFSAKDAHEKIQDFSRFEIHSIEQPIAVNHWDDLGKLCRESRIDIALDEELIGRNPFEKGTEILETIKPQYLIFKPGLLGGFMICDEWIRLARKFNIGWWATSALESNIGLNAIAQWVSGYQPVMPQGLGTGGLYQNNVGTPLLQDGSVIRFDGRKNNINEIRQQGKLVTSYEG